MTHFGIITPPVSGHLDPFGALGRELQARGHRVTLIHMEDLRQKAQGEEIEFYAIGQKDHPTGSLSESLQRLGKLKGLAALRYTVNAICKTTEMIGRDAPEAVRALKIDVLLVDQTEPIGASLAEHLGIPFITICNALAMNRDPMIPPPFTGWSYRNARWAFLRNSLGYALWDRAMKPLFTSIQQFRRLWKLPPCRDLGDSFSTLAQIAQQPAAFDYPRKKLPKHFHYVGPLRRSRLKSISFPWNQLDGRPLIYASLGSLQGGKARVFECIVDACKELPFQLVLSHAGALSQENVQKLSQHALVVPYAPQAEVLARAKLTITHAGLNTVLDSLTQGVPLVAIPITYEQPAIAQRIKWVGAGTIVPLKALNSARLRQAIIRTTENSSYYERAGRIGESIREAGGVEKAATIIAALRI